VAAEIKKLIPSIIRKTLFIKNPFEKK